jgi:hypothetical protein
MEQKRNLLSQWAFDAYRTGIATTEGMPPSAPSRVDEAIEALIELDGGTSKLSSMRAAKAGERKQHDAGDYVGKRRAFSRLASQDNSRTISRR